LKNFKIVFLTFALIFIVKNPIYLKRNQRVELYYADTHEKKEQAGLADTFYRTFGNSDDENFHGF